MVKTFAVLLFLCVSVYGDDPSAVIEGVAELTSGNFNGQVDGKDWLIEFYAPWCGWCKKLVPVWKELGTAAETVDGIHIGKFDATQQGSGGIAEKYGVKGFPSIMLIREDGTFKKYTGGRDTQSLLSYLGVELGTVSVVQEEDEVAQPHKPGQVMVLGANAEGVINDPTKNVFVKFYAPWCGHCKALEPEWVRLAAQTDDADIVIAEVDAAKHTAVGQKYSVHGYPTLKFFTKTDKTGIEYYGGRTASAFQKFVDSKSE
eukprot:TRINITY_DN3674_c0_g1_i1.p2 TRINITY_DN3674_c0_g1~~TRINITY_DN3674_c0_g1_i1.p2  ORF type:complete len:259 (+),score=46.36 TRINITY_DN3674_c0_g1_i1:1226-2002(+)